MYRNPTRLRIEGESKAVSAVGGLIDAAVDSIEVACTPNNMPGEFVIDVTDMEPGDVIRLADVPMPAGVTALGDPEMAVVSVLVTAGGDRDGVAPDDDAASDDAAADAAE